MGKRGASNHVVNNMEGKGMGRGRKLRPKWQIQVDALIFRYCDDPTTIRLQEGRLRELRLTGTSITANYNAITDDELEALQERGYCKTLVEGSRGGPTVFKADRYVQEIEQAEEQIRISQERMTLVNKLLCGHFSAEEQEFIRLFWLDVKPVDRGLVWLRNKAVIQEIRWFIDPDKRDRPSRDYHRWRLRIYTKWWNLLFPDMPKEETGTDYIEHKSLD